MDFLKTVANMAVGAAQNYYSTYTKQQKLREDLKKCTYTDDVKYVIEKAAKQVFNVYPNFTIEILEFMQKGQVKRFLELKSDVDIEIKGKVCKVDYYMMLPVNFPKKPPYVRIVNKDPSNIVHNFYIPLRSPTDPNSFILNQKLVQCRTWDENKSIVNIIIESYNMLRQNFPFMKPELNSFNQFGNQQYNNQYGNQGFYQNNNQGFNQYGGNNQNYGFVNNPNSNSNANMNKPRPPIPFVMTNVNEVIAKGQKLTAQSKKIMQKLKSEQFKSIQKIQAMEVMKYCLQSEQEYLRHENIKIANFLRSSQRSSIKDTSSLIRVRDERSQQILDLTCSIRAKQDCLNLLQSKFNENQLGFEEFMKLARKLEEQKFQEKFLLFKCIEKVK